MARLRFRRKPRNRSARTQPTEATSLSGAARRVNRLVAAVALIGAFGTVALAVALTPGAQQSASIANASQETRAVSEAASEPVVVEIATPPEPVVAMPPPRAAKSDRLFRTAWAERPAKADLAFAASPLRSSGRRQAGAPVLVMATQKPEFETGGRGPQPDLDAERETIEFGLSEPRAPGDASDDASAGASEEAAEEALDEAVEQATAAAVATEEAVEQAAEEPEPEVAAVTRTVPVTTDVNMRAGPSNDAAVVLVVRRNREVEVIGCKYWCEVIYDGKRGFIYKGFVRGS